MSAPIIITVPNYLALDEDSQVMVDVASPAPSRKRRLDHLSWEEKMQRKKLKNRVAAQTSRDRKKAKMDEMEDRLKKLMDANDRLVSEVESLKALNERLLSENAALSAARMVEGAQGPAEGRAPAGRPRGAPLDRDVPDLTELLAHFDSPEYLDSLHQLADSLLQEIDASAAGATQNVPVGEHSERLEGAQVVGPTAEQLEPSEGALVTLKQDVDRIMAQHSYAHPYSDLTLDVKIKEEDNDKGDIFYASCDEDNDCVTIEVPCEEEVAPITVETDFGSLTNNCSGITLECDMKMLSPMSLSPKSAQENLGLSPSHNSLCSDLGYQSLSSPLSETDSMDLSDFWCESFSELFPGLA